MNPIHVTFSDAGAFPYLADMVRLRELEGQWHLDC